MMLNYKNATLPFLLCLFFAISSCGKSPILHHIDADDLTQKQTESVIEKNPAEETPVEISESRSCDFRFTKTNQCANLEWVKHPDLRQRKDGSFLFRLWEGSEPNSNGVFTDPGYELRMYLFMKSMGHGAGDDIEVASLASATGTVLAGEYTTSNVFPIMRGDWQVHVELKRENRVVDSAEYCCLFNGTFMKCPVACP
jgi:hypothetical protein